LRERVRVRGQCILCEANVYREIKKSAPLCFPWDALTLSAICFIRGGEKGRQPPEYGESAALTILYI
jgi:hypothetical protein